MIMEEADDDGDEGVTFKEFKTAFKEFMSQKVLDEVDDEQSGSA